MKRRLCSAAITIEMWIEDVPGHEGSEIEAAKVARRELYSLVQSNIEYDNLPWKITGSNGMFLREETE